MQSTLASGRFAMTHTDAWGVGRSDTAEMATIETAGYTIIVAPMQLTVDGRPRATTEAGTKSIEVTVQNKHVSFVADGRLVATYAR